MSLATVLSRIDHAFRPYLTTLSPRVFTHLYSSTRPWFSALAAHDSVKNEIVPEHLKVRIRNITFRSPIANAAGMYKQAEGYERAYAQGAGYYIAGTTTSLPRIGNKKHGISLPFVPYPKSHSASNWLGLPNKGHVETARIISKFIHYPDFPIGASVSLDPGMNSSEGLQDLLNGIKAYRDAGCDFIELNESCPNVPGHTSEHDTLDASLISRLDVIAQEIDLRTFPIIVKFSNDTDEVLIKPLMAILLERNFAGINLGNTSTAYQKHMESIHIDDRKHVEYFIKEFGGGLSGAILQKSSLTLCKEARKHVSNLQKDDFAIIATGGIENAEDVNRAIEAGANLTQWYTGYYERFGIDGNRIYTNLYKKL